MLVTTCKHCGARFRVTPEQLNLRQGQVRCGECGELFSGFESLERFPGDGTGARFLAARAGRKSAFEPEAGLADLELGKRLPPGRDEPAPAGPASVDLSDIPDLPPEAVDAKGRGRPSSPASEPAPGPEPASVSAAPSALPPIEVYAEAPPARPSRAWAFGVVFLGLVLSLQLAYAYRAEIAQQYPVLRPVLESACEAAGCTVPWVNSEAALKLEDSELLEVPGKPGQIALQARIRNLAPSPQQYPHLELTLTDVTGQTAVRRVLRPADYLGRVPAAGEVMAGSSEALLSVRLETPNLRPTGYELLLFYP